MDGSQQPGRVQQVMAALSAALIVWFSLPEQERRWMVLRTVGSLHRFASRLARAEGYAGMGQELAGKRELARSRYGGALVAARLRDSLARLLEAMKP